VGKVEIALAFGGKLFHNFVQDGKKEFECWNAHVAVPWSWS